MPPKAKALNLKQATSPLPTDPPGPPAADVPNIGTPCGASAAVQGMVEGERYEIDQVDGSMIDHVDDLMIEEGSPSDSEHVELVKALTQAVQLLTKKRRTGTLEGSLDDLDQLLSGVKKPKSAHSEDRTSGTLISDPVSHGTERARQVSSTIKLPKLPSLKSADSASMDAHFERCKDILKENGFTDLNAATIKGALLETIRDCDEAYHEGTDLFKEDWKLIESELVTNYADSGLVRDTIEEMIAGLRFDSESMLSFVTKCRHYHRRFIDHSGTSARFLELILPKINDDIRRDLTRELLKGSGKKIIDVPVPAMLDKLQELIRAHKECSRFDKGKTQQLRKPERVYASVADDSEADHVYVATTDGARNEREEFIKRFKYVLYALDEEGKASKVLPDRHTLHQENKMQKKFILAGYDNADDYYRDLRLLAENKIYRREFNRSDDRQKPKNWSLGRSRFAPRK